MSKRSPPNFLQGVLQNQQEKTKRQECNEDADSIGCSELCRCKPGEQRSEAANGGEQECDQVQDAQTPERGVLCGESLQDVDQGSHESEECNQADRCGSILGDIGGAAAVLIGLLSERVVLMKRSGQCHLYHSQPVALRFHCISLGKIAIQRCVVDGLQVRRQACRCRNQDDQTGGQAQPHGSPTTMFHATGNGGESNQQGSKQGVVDSTASGHREQKGISQKRLCRKLRAFRGRKNAHGKRRENRKTEIGGKEQMASAQEVIRLKRIKNGSAEREKPIQAHPSHGNEGRNGGGCKACQVKDIQCRPKLIREQANQPQHRKVSVVRHGKWTHVQAEWRA